MEEALTALLASVAGGRRYWVRAPANINVNAGPYLVLNRVDGVPSYDYQGSAGYVQSRVQVDVYGKTYTATKDAVRALVAAVSGQSTGDIQAIFVNSERDLPAADAGEVNNIFRTSVDLILHHGE